MKESNISFHSVGTFSLKTEAAVAFCIKVIAEEESREVGDISFATTTTFLKSIVNFLITTPIQTS